MAAIIQSTIIFPPYDIPPYEKDALKSVFLNVINRRVPALSVKSGAFKRLSAIAYNAAP
jgi:hypothetical protein